MNVLFINPSYNRYAGIKGHGGSSAPLNLACLAAYLREQEQGDTVSILDAEAFGLDYEETLLKIDEFKPDILGITTTTPSFDVITELIGRIYERYPSLPMVLGGPHATGSPEECANINGVIAAVIGEGEVTFLELRRAVEAREPFDDIDGICFHDGVRTRFTNKRKQIEDLDVLPFPARDLLPMHLYRPPPTKSLSEERAVNILSSRGCPFHCTYCLSDMMWARKYRHRSAENVIEEMELLMKEYGIKEFNFNDDLFTANKKRLIHFCELLIEKDLGIQWICMSRADYIKPEIARLMKKAGCGKIAMGLESGSPEVLKLMNKKIDPEESIKAVKIIKDAGIKVGVSFVIGHVGETEETIKKTVDLAKRCNPDTVAFFQASPYPGTEFYQMVKDAGYLRENLKWSDFAIVANNISTVNLPGLPAEVIHEKIKDAYRSFYLSPRYILSQINRITSLKDIRNLFEGVIIFMKLALGRTSR